MKFTTLKLKLRKPRPQKLRKPLLTVITNAEELQAKIIRTPIASQRQQQTTTTTTTTTTTLQCTQPIKCDVETKIEGRTAKGEGLLNTSLIERLEKFHLVTDNDPDLARISKLLLEAQQLEQSKLHEKLATISSTNKLSCLPFNTTAADDWVNGRETDTTATNTTDRKQTSRLKKQRARFDHQTKTPQNLRPPKPKRALPVPPPPPTRRSLPTPLSIDIKSYPAVKAITEQIEQCKRELDANMRAGNHANSCTLYSKLDQLANEKESTILTEIEKEFGRIEQQTIKFVKNMDFEECIELRGRIKILTEMKTEILECQSLRALTVDVNVDVAAH